METGNKETNKLKFFLRALRLPFVTASILPFTLGSLAANANFDPLKFFLGLTAAITTHLGANLINDYADSLSGVDWQDKNFYGFFGGSKLIQENVLPEKFYLKSAVLFFGIAFVCIFILALILNNPIIFLFFFIILFLGTFYSVAPLRFCYRRLGEPVIFLLFGPALVMGGYFIQTQIFPDLKSFLISLPLGFLTAAILFSNEIPDYNEDKKSGKHTLVDICGIKKAYLFYIALITYGFASIAINVLMGFLGWIAIISFFFIVPALKAADILKERSNKTLMTQSSKLTIFVHTFVAVVLILDVII